METADDLEFENRIEEMLQVPGLEFTGSPIEKLFYIYRWGGTGSYHMSSFDGETGANARVLDCVAESIRLGQLPRGEIVLKPHWKVDYVDMVARHLGSLAESPAAANR